MIRPLWPEPEPHYSLVITNYQPKFLQFPSFRNIATEEEQTFLKDLLTKNFKENSDGSSGSAWQKEKEERRGGCPRGLFE